MINNLFFLTEQTSVVRCEKSPNHRQEMPGYKADKGYVRFYKHLFSFHSQLHLKKILDPGWSWNNVTKQNIASIYISPLF